MSARFFASRRFSSLQSPRAPTPWRPYIATYTTVGICCSGFAYNLYANDRVRKKQDFWHRNFIDKNLVFTRDNYNGERWWTMFTYSFMHTSGLHLAVNMLALSSFGPICVGLVGLPSTAVLWLGGSASAMYLTMVGEDYKKNQAKSRISSKPISIAGYPLPQGRPTDQRNMRFIGASGSLLSILAAVACKIPRHGVYVFPLPMAVPMYGAIGGFAVFSAIAYVQDLVPFLGHAGHLGGMVFGAAYYILALRTKRFPRI
ncbi:MAG: hypothetical protein L6R38_004982 [Xanthoria sp. 2 TBL-2021]|nr:MAG: hypothetical protein L6R38_004982 [Xanthoria sp. 2 TBL-2021]